MVSDETKEMLKVAVVFAVGLVVAVLISSAVPTNVYDAVNVLVIALVFLCIFLVKGEKWDNLKKYGVFCAFGFFVIGFVVDAVVTLVVLIAVIILTVVATYLKYGRNNGRSRA